MYSFQNGNKQTFNERYIFKSTLTSTLLTVVIIEYPSESMGHIFFPFGLS